MDQPTEPIPSHNPSSRRDDRRFGGPSGGACRSGDMAMRWAAAGMLAAEGQFRRVKGYRELPQLALALELAAAEKPGLLDLPPAVGA